MTRQEQRQEKDNNKSKSKNYIPTLATTARMGHPKPTAKTTTPILSHTRHATRVGQPRGFLFNLRYLRRYFRNLVPPYFVDSGLMLPPWGLCRRNWMRQTFGPGGTARTGYARVAAQGKRPRGDSMRNYAGTSAGYRAADSSGTRAGMGVSRPRRSMLNHCPPLKVWYSHAFFVCTSAQTSVHWRQTSARWRSNESAPS